jgi:hypothetical protein
MPLKTDKGKKHVTFFIDVILPDNIRRISIPDAKADEFDTGAELKIVKELVQQTIADQRDVKRLQRWCLTFHPLN